MFTHISNQTSNQTMNPTGDKLTAELQQTIYIEQPVVVGVGENSSTHTLKKKLGEGVQAVASGVEYTGQKLGEGLETIASGVEYTGEKLKATVGETLASVTPTVVATGEKIEKTIHKAAEAVAEEKVELPGVVTLLQNGAARIFGHLTGSTSTSTSTSVEEVIPAPPPIIEVSDRKETVVLAGQLMTGDIITTDIQSGHSIHNPPSRVDVMKESGQLGPQSDLHLPNLKISDVPLNRAVEEQPSTQPAALPESVQLPSLTKKEVEDGANFIDVVEQKTTQAIQAEATQFPSFVYIHPSPEEQSTPLLPEHSASNNLEYRDESEQQLPHLTKKAVQDGTVFMEKAEQQQKTENVSQKDVGTESVPKEQLPNLTTKAVHDGAVFIDQLEHQKFNTQKAKGNTSAVDPQLPNLETEKVHDGVEFLDVVENSGQS